MPKIKYRTYEYVCRTDSFFPEKLQETANKLEELITQILGSNRYKSQIEVYVTSITENKTRYIVKVQESFLERCKKQKFQLKTLVMSRSLRQAIDIEWRRPAKTITWGSPMTTVNGVFVLAIQSSSGSDFGTFYVPIRDYWIYQLVMKGELPPLN